MGRLRFAAVISHPIQHFSPLFGLLAKDEGIELKAFYLCDFGARATFDPGFNTTFSWDIELAGSHDHEFLKPGYAPKRFGFFQTDSSEIAHRLSQYKPHAIWIHGYSQLICWRAIWWARRRAATIYFGDSELIRERGSTVRALKAAVLPRFFKKCTRVLTIGDNNEAYYRHYGVPDRKMVRGCCPVDIERFRLAAEQTTYEEETELKRGLNIPSNAFVVAMSGKLEPIKRPLDLVNALHFCSSNDRPIHLLFIGDGRLRERVVQISKELNLANRVHVTGFVNQMDMPRMVSITDVLVAASERDAHPLSVTEALPAGLPIVISDRVGCVGSTDTARPGVNAIVYPCGNVRALARAISDLESDRGMYEKLSKASRMLADSQSFSAAASAVYKTLTSMRRELPEAWSNIDQRHWQRWEFASNGDGLWDERS